MLKTSANAFSGHGVMGRHIVQDIIRVQSAVNLAHSA